MFGIKAKRPPSARRNIKQETFSPFASMSRLRKIQELLKSSEDNDSQKDTKPDALLCVLGIDGRYNDGTIELINYLLFGFFEVRKTELERSGYAEEVLDDLIFYIRRQSVDIYCNPTNYHYLLPYVAHWRNLHIHCLPDDKCEDEEYAEEFKINSFLAMVQGSKMVGIPYCGTGQHMEFDKMTIEKWPIVQAYAVEGIGGGTFFTMKYEVMDISGEVQRVLNCMDPVSLEMLVTEQLPLFERQWNNMLLVCDLERSEQPMQITEGKVCEPLSSYFSHGRVVTAKGGRSLPIRHPFVLFGSHTSRHHLEDAHKSGISFNSDPNSTGLEGKPAHHMICQAVSPRGPLSCTRTYFFNTTVAPLPMGKAESNVINPSTEMNDARLLQEVYLAVVKSVLQAINVYSMTLSLDKAEEFARFTLQSECRKQEIPLNSDICKSRKYVSFHLCGYDNHNRPVPVSDGKSSPFVKTLGITTYNIPSIEHSGQILGSVSYAESFLETSLNVLYPDGSCEQNGDCTVLTSHVTRYITWPYHSSSAKTVELVEAELKCEKHEELGRRLVNGESAHLVVDGHSDVIIRSGDLFIYERGVVFIHPHLGALVLPKTDTAEIHFYDGESPSTVALLILTYKDDVTYYIPPHLKSDKNRIIFAFQPKSKSYKALFSSVLPYWKHNDEQPILEMLDELPEELNHVHHQLQQEYTQQIQTVLPSSGCSLKQAKCKLPDLHSFLQHFVASSVGEAPICSKHLAAVLEQPYDQGSFDGADEMVVTIIGGVPGSHKNDLCTSLTRLAKEDSRWAVLKQPIESTDIFTAENLQTSIATTWRAQRRRKPGQSAKKMRAIVVTSGFTDIVDVVQAIVSHPDSDVSRAIKIGSVTVCVDPTNAFMQDAYTLPKLVDNCSQGWVNCVLFTGSLASQQSQELENLQRLVRAANSDVALLMASNGDVTRSPDLDLILSETAFNQDSLVRARYLSCPGWWLGTFDSGVVIPEMTEICLEFSQPLEKKKLLLKLKSLRSSHTSFPFSGNLYQLRGKLKFSDSPQMYELNFVVLSGCLTLTPAELQPMPPSRMSNGHSPHSCCIVFTGCDLEESKLKDWLRTCGKQKLENKTPRTMNSLSRQEINKIHKQHHLDSLPEGWFYNGTHFVSLAGDRSDTHPDLEKFLTDYVDGLNSEIKEYNHCVDMEAYHDLFEE